jgi:predicted dehydrogenase
MNVVHVGYGYWGANVAKNLARSKKVGLFAVCDMNPENLERAKALYGDSVRYEESYKAFIDNPDVDAFVLAVQTEPSFEIAKDILNAGKHLFIEKPIATNAERAQILTDLAREKNLILHCDHIMIFHPIIRYIKKMVQSGELGDITSIEVSRANLGPVRMDVTAMMDLAVHDIAVVDYLTDGKIPLSVHAVGEKLYGEQETLTFLTMKYDGFIAHIKSSWISPVKERTTLVCGTKKMVIFDDMRGMDKLSIFDCGIVKRDEHDEYGLYEFKARTGDILSPYIPQEDALLNSIEHFADCVKSGTQSISNGEQSVKVMKILDKAHESMRGI